MADMLYGSDGQTYESHAHFMADSPITTIDNTSTVAPGGSTEAADALESVAHTYPTLAPYTANSVLQQGKPTGPDDDRQLEFYQPDDASNPNPGKNTLEIFNKDLKGPDLTDTIAGDLLHRVGALDSKTGKPVDPTFYAMKQELSNAREDFHKTADADAYERDKKSPYGAADNQKDWDKQSRLDAYVRAVTFPKQNPEWNKADDSFVTPKMKEIGAKMQSYLRNGNAQHIEPGYLDGMSEADRNATAMAENPPWDAMANKAPKGIKPETMRQSDNVEDERRSKELEGFQQDYLNARYKWEKDKNPKEKEPDIHDFLSEEEDQELTDLWMENQKRMLATSSVLRAQARFDARNAKSQSTLSREAGKNDIPE